MTFNGFPSSPRNQVNSSPRGGEGEVLNNAVPAGPLRFEGFPLGLRKERREGGGGCSSVYRYVRYVVPLGDPRGNSGKRVGMPQLQLQQIRCGVAQTNRLKAAAS